MKYFITSSLVFLIGLIGAYFIRHNIYDVFIVFILALLEISISFDNAVVNAKVLSKMDVLWQKLFIWIGIPIAVFGMRFLFPLVLVAITSNHSIAHVFHLAVHQPQLYQQAIESSNSLLFSFGAGFLGMVFVHFMIEPTKTHTWIKWIEESRYLKPFQNRNMLAYIPVLVLALVLGFIVSYQAAIAFMIGVAINAVLVWFNEVFSPKEGVKTILTGGIFGFLYLEVLDASFSFDGVLGAFALSSNIFIIMIGLGIGAMFVRSLTIYFVEKKTLTQFYYLEHGAHYAIGFLACVMLSELFIHVPPIITGLVGILLISKSLYDSRV